MKKDILFAVVILGAAMGLAGCGKNLPTPTAASNSSPAMSFSYTLAGAIGIPSGGVSMDYPAGLALFGNDLWVTNTTGNDFQAWTLDGAPVTNITTYNSTSFTGPLGAAVGPDGFLYVVDAGNNQLAVFRPNGDYYTTLGHNKLFSPSGVAVNASYICVAEDNYPGAIYQIAVTGTGDMKTYGAPVTITPTGSGALSNPLGLALDSSNNLYVADQASQRVAKFNASMVFQSALTLQGNTWGVALDPSGNLFVSAQLEPIQVYNPSGSPITQFGSNSDDYGLIALDPNDDVYVTDTLQQEVLFYKRN